MRLEKIKILDFYEFIYNRQLIWYNRETLKKPWPWTKNEILRTYKFCNVYRELDKGSIYLIKTIINNKRLSLEDKFLNCVAYRRFNLPGFFDWIGGIMSCKNFMLKVYIKALEKRKEEGYNLFNDAYIVSQTPYDRKFGRKEKFVQQLLILKDLSDKSTAFGNIIKSKNNLKEIHEYLKNCIFGMGDFLAYQTCTDLTYFPEFTTQYKDLNSFVAMGPGSKPGIDLLFPRHIADRDILCKKLWKEQDLRFFELKEKTGKDWLKIRYKKAYYRNEYLSLSNIQNCLCEFRKYVMLQIDPNKRKRYYRPKGVKNG